MGDVCIQYWDDVFNGLDDLGILATFFDIPDFMAANAGMDPEVVYAMWISANEDTLVAYSPPPDAGRVSEHMYPTGTVCNYTIADGTIHRVRVDRVDIHVIPYDYTVSFVGVVPTRMREVVGASLSPFPTMLDLSKNTTFKPNTALANLGYTNGTWNPVHLNSLIPHLFDIFQGEYANVTTNFTWKTIYERIIREDESNGWLDSEIIHFFMNWCARTYGGLTTDNTEAEAQKYFRDKLASGETTYMTLEDTQLHHMDGTYRGVGSLWSTNRFKPWIKNMDPLGIHNILFTINVNCNHWILGRINLRDTRIEIYDSLNQPNDTIAADLNQFKRDFYARKLRDDNDELNLSREHIVAFSDYARADWPVTRHAVPQQEDGKACGVLTCMYLAYIMSGIPEKIPSDLIFANVSLFRSYLAKIICETNYDTLYPPGGGPI